MASDTAAPRAAESTAVAAIWLVGGRLIARSIDLVTLLVLARILGPAEFGAVAVAMTLILIVEAISEMPVSFVLVRAPEVTQSMLDTAFTLSMIRGIGIAVILALLAIPYASFNNDLNLVPLICVLAFAPAIRSLISPAMVHFVRAIDFRREFVLDIVGKLATLVVAVTVAYIAQNYWAIAAGTVAAPVVMAIASYFFAPYFPRLTLKEWNQFSSLLQWNTASQFLAAINWQIDRLLLGRMASREDLGRFSIANDLTAIPYQALVIPVVRPLMAGLSALPDEPVRLGQAYRKTTAAIMMVGAPALIGMAVLSEEIVRLILGPKWSEAALMLALLAVSGVAPLLAAPFGSLAIRLGRFQYGTLQTLLEFVVKIPAMVIGVYFFGVMGALIARIICGLGVAFTSMVLVRRLIGLPLTDQLIAPWRPAVASIAMAACLLPVLPLLTTLSNSLTLALGVTIAVGWGAGLYTVFVFILWRLSGQPEGAEAIIAAKATAIVRRVFRKYS
ncbi:MAG: lipopolysaccharide biosynthesis protein [Hyphomicrobiales bacterium]|nr:lipopolysaccharide biosynthesis protein [Hyphomicrobiales bacterium]